MNQTHVSVIATSQSLGGFAERAASSCLRVK
jgi:hypothetical protein